MRQASKPVPGPPSAPTAASSTSRDESTASEQRNLPQNNQQHHHQPAAETNSTAMCTQPEEQTADASSTHTATQPDTQTAGLPKVHEGTLKVLCVGALLAGLAASKAWSAADQEAYELCLHWSHQHVTAWMDRQDRAAPSQHALHNYPVLEPHAAICKYPSLSVIVSAWS